MSSNVTPSIPVGFTLYLLASVYASRRVSSLLTCTNRPQKSPFKFCLRLHVYPSPQVPQLDRRLSHLASASRCCRSHYRQQGRFPPPALPGFLGTTNPSATLSPVSRLPGVRLYGLPCSADFSPGRGGLLQLLSASSSPCRRSHHAGVPPRFSQSALHHAAFVPLTRTRPPRHEDFVATCAFAFATAR